MIEEKRIDSKIAQRSKDIEYIVDKRGCHVCISHPKNHGGYPVVGRGGKLLRMNRYIYEKYYDLIPPGMLVMHTCDNPSCINPEHLRLGTPQDNVRDMINKGRCKPPCLRGEEQGMSKLTEEQVRTIKRNKEYSVKDAERYGVTQPTLHAIKIGKTWRHVDG